MPIYSFICRDCGAKRESLQRDVLPCNCGGLSRRDYHFAVKADTPGHFNHSVGAYVSNNREFRDELKKKSEEASARFGIDVNYAPIDYTDKQSLGVTNEGLSETKQRRSELNMAPLKALEDI